MERLILVLEAVELIENLSAAAKLTSEKAPNLYFVNGDEHAGAEALRLARQL